MRRTCGKDVRATILFFPKIVHKYSTGPFVTAEGCEPDFYPKQNISDTMRAGTWYQPGGKMRAVGALPVPSVVFPAPTPCIRGSTLH